MGLAFIRSTARQPHTKSWNDAYQRAADELFAGICTPVERTLLAIPAQGAALREGEKVHVRLIEDRVLAYRDLSPVAEIEKPSLDVRESLSSCYGLIDGYVEEVNELAGLVSIHVGKRREP